MKVKDTEDNIVTKDSMKSFTVVGKAAVDEYFKPQSGFHVYQQFEEVYHRTLIFTSMKDNSNKFYIIIQILF